MRCADAGTGGGLPLPRFPPQAILERCIKVRLGGDMTATVDHRSGAIELVTEIPGPRSREIIARREAATTAAAAKLTPIAVARAHGSVVEDVDGNRLIDLAGGIGALAVGHAPERVVAAIEGQVRDFIHMCAIVASYEPFVEVAERLNAITPGDFAKKTFITNTGAEAVEAAVKISRVHTGRQAVVVFEGAYHGRSNLTMAMTSKYGLFKKGFGPFAPEVYRLPFPNVYRKPDQMTADEFVDYHVALLDHEFVAQVDPAHVACVVIEPVQGEGGFLPVPARFMQKLREICDANGIVLVADEVQSGFGRTGTLFAIEQLGVVPDLVCTAKSLAAGMPLSAVTGRAEMMDAPHVGGLGGTYSGNPLACVAARESIDMITAPGFLARSAEVGKRIRDHLDRIQADNAGMVGDVRGMGSMLAIELVADPQSKTPDMDSTIRVVAETLARGVITIRAGLYSNCVRFLPPLTISDDEIDEAMAVVAEAVAVAASAREAS
jgi:4-aminobutyrate aminotransferase/(S)-3-amino-2-methylpropionate transaminase